MWFRFRRVRILGFGGLLPCDASVFRFANPHINLLNSVTCRHYMSRTVCFMQKARCHFFCLMVALLLVPTANSQSGGIAQVADLATKGTRNVSVVHSTPMKAIAVDVDQDQNRPFAYVALLEQQGFVITSLTDGSIVGKWVPAATTGNTVDVAILKSENQFLLALISSTTLNLVDVTNVKSPSLIRSVLLTDNSVSAMSLKSVFAYRHSLGPAIIGVATGADVRLFDVDDLKAGTADGTRIVTPETLERGTSGFDYVYMQYHLPSGQDRLYGGGAAGYHLFDISNPQSPEPIASVNPATIARGQVVAPTPDGRYVVTTAGYEWSPVRIFDLQPMFDGETRLVKTSESAWTPNWKGLTRAVEVRWPLVFTASSGDGMYVFNLRDPAAPYTVGYFHTSDASVSSAGSGAFDIDVRNSDGLIVVADAESGLWVLKLDELQGWNGNGYGQPNASSAQDWVTGPDMTGPE